MLTLERFSFGVGGRFAHHALMKTTGRKSSPTRTSRTGVTSIRLKPRADAEITKVRFAQFRWVVQDPAVGKAH